MILREIKNYIQNLRSLLEAERCADFRAYSEMMKNTSIAARKEEGVCRFPTELSDTFYDSAENLLVKIKWSENESAYHAFQSGSPVQFFSLQDTNTEDTVNVEAVVNRAGSYELTATLKSSKFPNWLNAGKIGVQLLFDDSSYKDTDAVLKRIAEKPADNEMRFLGICAGYAVPSFKKEYPVEIPRLNKSQNKALSKLNAAKDVGIIHGPPGTGKTTSLVEVVKFLLKSEKQIMVCAPGNAAVDLLTEKFIEEEIKVVRIGHPARINERVFEQTIDRLTVKHEAYKQLKHLRREAEKHFRAAGKFKRKYGSEERQKKRDNYLEAKQLKEEAGQLEFYITQSILSEARVITCTPAGSGKAVLEGMKFSSVFIDEAAQALEALTWIPMSKAERVFFAGDHLQLPPTVKSAEAQKGGMRETLFEKIVKKHPQTAVMLETQYRMNKDIMNFSNQYFYKGKLKADISVAEHKLFAEDTPAEFIDTAGCGFDEETDPKTLSTFNRAEAEFLIDRLEKLLGEAEYSGIIKKLNGIGIISPYRAQVRLLKELTNEKLNPPDYIRKLISINTVDAFQGQERNIIIISLVRSNTKSKIGFLSDLRRMNVAMTRAQKKLMIIGDSATVAQNRFYKQMVDYFISLGSYRSAFEYMY